MARRQDAVTARPRQHRAEQVLPAAYFLLALVLVLAVLPTVLRTKPPSSNQTAALSPDAPPDKQQSIISSFAPASSGTAGSAAGAAPSDAGGTTTTVPPGRASNGAVSVAKACAHGFGDPPRQTFSWYSPPCAPAWSGDNGGATWKGVSGGEVRVAAGWPSAGIGTDGFVANQRDPSQHTNDRTMTDFQIYFNQSYQFWGRSLRLCVANGTDTPADEPAFAQKIEATCDPFAAAEGRPIVQSELAHRQIVSIGEQIDQYQDRFFEQYRPYIYTVTDSATHLIKLTAEYLCKKLAGKTAQYSGTFTDKPRVWGIIFSDTGDATRGLDNQLEGLTRAQCGLTFAKKIAIASGSSTNDLAAAVSQFEVAGVTTVVSALDFSDMSQVTTYARGQDYQPEYVINGMGELDLPVQAHLMDQVEWSHAFGFTTIEMNIPQNGLGAPITQTDCFQAVQIVDPGFVPDPFSCNVFQQLEEIAKGIQLAGPRLTPQAYESGLFAFGRRRAQPGWTMGGGYYIDHWAYPDEAGEFWYDPASRDDSGNLGTYRWTRGCRRARLGEFDRFTTELFEAGATTRAQCT